MNHYFIIIKLLTNEKLKNSSAVKYLAILIMTSDGRFDITIIILLFKSENVYIKYIYIYL